MQQVGQQRGFARRYAVKLPRSLDPCGDSRARAENVPTTETLGTPPAATSKPASYEKNDDAAIPGSCARLDYQVGEERCHRRHPGRTDVATATIPAPDRSPPRRW